MRGEATYDDDIFGYAKSGSSNNLSKNKLRKAHDNNADRAGFATINYECSVCKKFIRKSEYHIHEAGSSKGVRKDNGNGKRTIPDGGDRPKTRFKPIKITKKIQSFNEGMKLLHDEINSSEALANNPCLSCSVECFCIEEKHYLACGRIENWIINSLE